jgi:hypothetical protein
MSVLYNKRFRVCWGVASAVGVAAFVCVEASLRKSGRSSPLAPSTALFTIGIVAGLAFGALSAAWERYLLLHKRAWMSRFQGLPVRERLRWAVQKENLAMNGWWLAAVLVQVACCWYWTIFVLPPVLAMNVAFLANTQLAADFDAQLSPEAG